MLLAPCADFIQRRFPIQLLRYKIFRFSEPHEPADQRILDNVNVAGGTLLPADHQVGSESGKCDRRHELKSPSGASSQKPAPDGIGCCVLLWVVIATALVSRLTFITIQAVTLVARLSFIAELARGNAGGDSFFQFYDV